MKRNRRFVEMLLQARSCLISRYHRIGDIYRNCLQLQSLINGSFVFRKQELECIKIRVNHYEMIAFLKGCFLVLEEYARKNSVQLQLVTSEAAIDMWFDSKQMQKVINNLLLNAIKYTPGGGIVTLTVNKKIDKVVISVKNIGISSTFSDWVHILNSFYRSRDAIEGTEIGLVLAKGIVELHGGTVNVESKEGESAIFSFCLPLGCAHYRPEEMIQDVDGTGRKESGPKFKILIVEGDEDLRAILTDIFTPFYFVEQVADGQEGLNKIASFHPDVIISNVLLPLMSGVDLCRRVKTDVSTSQIPVVLFTTNTTMDYELEGLKFGADGYIVKPFNVNVLLGKCQNLIKLRIANQGQFMKEPQITTQVSTLTPLDKEFVNRGMELVEENLANPKFNMSMFAQKMGMSRSAFFSKWKKLTDQSPNDYIIDFRLKRASVLLKENPELNITEISEITGFNTVGYFGRVFKEKFEMTPSAFRKKEKSKDN